MVCTPDALAATEPASNAQSQQSATWELVQTVLVLRKELRLELRRTAVCSSSTVGTASRFCHGLVLSIGFRGAQRSARKKLASADEFNYYNYSFFPTLKYMNVTLFFCFVGKVLVS